jgi:hypothetical protein
MESPGESLGGHDTCCFHCDADGEGDVRGAVCPSAVNNTSPDSPLFSGQHFTVVAGEVIPIE